MVAVFGRSGEQHGDGAAGSTFQQVGFQSLARCPPRVTTDDFFPSTRFVRLDSSLDIIFSVIYVALLLETLPSHF